MRRTSSSSSEGGTLVRDQSADPLDARVPEDFAAMGSVGELRGQVLACEMKLLMQPGPPFGAIGDIVDDAGAGNVHAGAALAGVASQLSLGYGPFGMS